MKKEAKPRIEGGERYYNTTNAAHYLGVSRKTFYEREYHIRLKHHYFSKHKNARAYFAENELNKYR